jgi:hypothetical protein
VSRILGFRVMGSTGNTVSIRLSRIPGPIIRGSAASFSVRQASSHSCHAKLARMPAVIARAALRIIFSTAIITTLLGWWFLAR